jgi:hypothetical protein
MIFTTVNQFLKNVKKLADFPLTFSVFGELINNEATSFYITILMGMPVAV